MHPSTSSPRHWTADYIRPYVVGPDEIFIGYDETGQIYSVHQDYMQVVDDLIKYAQSLEQDSNNAIQNPESL